MPTVHALAAAEEQQILRLWQGLGYYSRARNLRAAALAVVERFCGEVPQTIPELLTLPGIGRYTAGAIASLAYDRRAPIVDGNVSRVICRLDRIEAEARDHHVLRVLWGRAEEILPKRHCGDFNSALMELGATICTPRAPKCLICPVAAHCESLAGGTVDRIPSPRKSSPTPLIRRRVVCALRDDQTVLIEQRPPRGRWAGMWQFATFDENEDWTTIQRSIGRMSHRRSVARLKHQLTHRRYEFEVWVVRCNRPVAASPPRRWVCLHSLSDYPLPRPHVMIAAILRNPRSNRSDQPLHLRRLANAKDQS
jgi:A/G-specific adenine glycosylase